MTREPWQRHPEESPKAFAAFCLYRDLNPESRSLHAAAVKAVEAEGKASGSRGEDVGAQRARARERAFERWSHKYAWPARAAAWDEEKDRRHRAALLDEVDAVARRHCESARSITDTVMAALNDIPAPKDAQAAYFRACAFIKAMGVLPRLQEAERKAMGICHKRQRAAIHLPAPAFLELPEAERPCHPREERRLYQVVADGMPLHDAARVANLDPAAVELWRAQAADGSAPFMAFARNLERCEAIARLHLVREMREDGQAARAAPWLLERRWPEDYRLVDEDKVAELLDQRDARFEDALTKTILRFVPEDLRQEAAEAVLRAFRGDREDEDDDD